MKKRQMFYLAFKRIISIIGSLIGILLCLTLIWWWVFIINLFVSKGHPVFRQKRVGKNGKQFGMLKFRSMSFDANPNMTGSDEDKYNKVTKFGHFLRKSSIDETLQLFNILIGQMAFVGPRPLIDSGEDHITVELRKQNGSIKLRPGITGYAQVSGRTEVSPEEKGKLDGYYFEHLSFWFDIKVFLGTIFGLFRKNGSGK